MSVAIITGSGGLIGSEAVRLFAAEGFDVVGIDNDLRAAFFGPEASTSWNVQDLQRAYPARYRHIAADIRDFPAMEKIFVEYAQSAAVIIHTAAQPSHDWAASAPDIDFTVNANGTLNLLELTRRHAPEVPFIFTSTNKVYGDLPNLLPLIEKETRWEIAPDHPYANGIDESMSIDQSKHSLFGVSKAAADLLVQEYGRYFGLKTAAFRGGCLTGPAHSGAQLHGFLAYLMKCCLMGTTYTIFGYGGKQVRDNIHSYDLVRAFWEFFQAPRSGEVYNIGGSRFSHSSLLEARDLCEEVSGRKLSTVYTEANRAGDHIWYVSDVSKFSEHYPNWKLTYGMREIVEEIYQAQRERSRAMLV